MLTIAGGIFITTYMYNITDVITVIVKTGSAQ